MEFISEGIIGKYSKMKILVLTFLKKANCEAFFRPSTLKKISRVGYVCIEESVDTFSIWVVVEKIGHVREGYFIYSFIRNTELHSCTLNW